MEKNKPCQGDRESLETDASKDDRVFLFLMYTVPLRKE